MIVEEVLRSSCSEYLGQSYSEYEKDYLMATIAPLSALSIVGNTLQKNCVYMILFSFKGVRSTKCWSEANSNKIKTSIKAIKPQKKNPSVESSQPRERVSNAIPNKFPNIFIKRKIKRQRMT